MKPVPSISAPVQTKAPLPAQATTEETTTRNSYSTELDAPEIHDEDIIDFHDLPDSIKMQLPAINVSAHVYSDNPLQRSIVINNNFMEEGERIMDDLILQEITKGGVLMNYQGTVFRYDIVSGWQ